MKLEEAFREAEVFSLTRGVRFCVYGYPTPSGRWTYTFHARSAECGTRESTHPARADRPCVVCGNYPSACICRVGDGSPRAFFTPVDRCHHGHARDVCGPCYFGDDGRATDAEIDRAEYDDDVWPTGGVTDIREAFALELRAQGVTA